MQRFKGIAALLLLVLIMPLPRSCAAMVAAAVSSDAHLQKACCTPHPVDTCCDHSSQLCGAARVPGSSTLYLGQSASPIVFPVVNFAIVTLDRETATTSRRVMPRRPAEHSPPGLVIAATIVLRI